MTRSESQQTEYSGELIEQIDRYLEDLFVGPDPVLEANIANSRAAGLPPINVTANQGKFLYLLMRIGGAKRALEIGTLGGFSTTWLARALPEGGRLISLEFSPEHAAVARKNLAAAGLDGIVEVRVGAAADSLQAMIEAGEGPFDFVFIDADKPGYVRYLELALRMSRPGTVIVGDNIVRRGAVLEENPESAMVRGIQAFNAAVAAHPRLESVGLAMYKNTLDGMSVSRVK